MKTPPCQNPALFFRGLLLLVAAGCAFASPRATAVAPVITVASPEARHAALAARELRRYVYLRSGALPVIESGAALPGRGGIVIALKTSPALPEAIRAEADALKPEQYVIRSVPGLAKGGVRTDWVVGGDSIGLLYGAYRYAEHLGVRFYLHGDVVPDARADWADAVIPDETGKPLFVTRGILPFHDFPEGPDWWSLDDYLLYLAQLPKMRMNFAGLHCYPESRVGPEPLVWIGLKSDVSENGNVRYSYPAFWFNTRNDRWGFDPLRSTAFASGAGLLFESEFHGPAVMRDELPMPTGLADTNALFNRVGELLAPAFAQARSLGVKIAVGTETPLTIPEAVARRLRETGRDPKDPATAQAVYEGMFARIMRTSPVDYYWLWTPEIWTWSGNDPVQFQETVSDINAARRALDSLGNPFALATAGWVLGPLGDRTALDRLLPPESPMGCISREVGHAFIEPGFGDIQNRPKWAMPWVENDPNLTAPQLWVARMRYDTADSLRLGCDGVMVNHWRTRIMAPNIAAIAEAAWDQSYVPEGWNLRAGKGRPAGMSDKKILGGRIYRSEIPVAGTDESFIYQSMREDLEGYDFVVPPGSYTVTLRFNEPAAGAPGQRVFGIQIQDRVVEPALDIYARVGANHALDLACPGIVVAEDKPLALRFQKQTGMPCVSAITLEGKSADGKPVFRKMRCGWIEPVLEYEGDREGDRPSATERARSMPVDDFYLGFVKTNFGVDARDAREIAAVFAALDGLGLPELGTWIRGPGGINARPVPPEMLAPAGQLEALRARVQGAGNLERYDYWLNNFRALRLGAEAAALRSSLDSVVAQGLRAPDPVAAKAKGREAVALRIRMARTWERMIATLLATVSTPGDIGTIVNHELHNRARLRFLDVHDETIARLAGQALPREAAPDTRYTGDARLVVTTARNSIRRNERLEVKVVVLDEGTPRAPRLHWRKIGATSFQQLPFTLVSKNTYRVELPAGDVLGESDFEYYISGISSTGRELFWPASAPEINQTMIQLETEA